MEKTWKLDHVGVVVKDLEKAIEYYQSLGMGPFVPNPSESAADRKIYGKPAPNVKVKGVVAQMGPIKFELMQPIEGESLQKEFLKSKGEGINHIGFVVDDLEGEMAKLEEKGFKVISGGKIPPNGGFAYFDTDKLGGVIFALELIKKR